MEEAELRRILKRTLGLRWYGAGGSKLPLLHEELVLMLRASAAAEFEVVGRASANEQLKVERRAEEARATDTGDAEAGTTAAEVAEAFDQRMVWHEKMAWNRLRRVLREALHAQGADNASNDQLPRTKAALVALLEVHCPDARVSPHVYALLTTAGGGGGDDDGAAAHTREHRGT